MSGLVAPRVALTASVLILAWATAAFAQAPTVLECNLAAELTSTPRFDPPVRGPLTYEWRDSTGRILGSEDRLTVTLPVGSHTFALVVTAETRATATNRLTVLVRDATPPRVGVRSDLVAAPSNGAIAGATEVARAAGFTVADRCDPRPTVTVSPTGPYPAGDTQVRLTAVDASGNNASVAVVIRVPRPEASPRPSGGQVGRGALQGAPAAGGIPTPGALGPDRSQQSRGGPATSPSTPPVPPAQPAEPSGPGTAPESPVPVTPPEPAVPETPQDPTAGSAPGANDLVQVPPVGSEPPQAPAATTPAATVILPPGAASPGSPGSTDAVGLSWWWFIVPGGLLLAGLLLLARRSRDGVPPPLRPTVSTLPKIDRGSQSLRFPPGIAQPRFEIRMRPRLDSTPRLVVSETSIVEERRTHA